MFFPDLRVAIEGVFERTRFLKLLRDFIVFEDDGGGTTAKKMEGYHQFHAMEAAVAETLRATELRQAAPIELRDASTRAVFGDYFDTGCMLYASAYCGRLRELGLR